MELEHFAADYLQAFIALAPKGLAWTQEPDSNWIKLLDALSQEYARVDGRANDLLNEAFPNTSTELISNWERIAGLPDEWSDPDASIEERRNAVVFKLQARGGQSAVYIESLIKALGYDSLIFDALTSDSSMSGDFVLDDSWLYYFLVMVRTPVVRPDLLEGRVRSVKPAQSQAVFYYTGSTSGGTLSDIEILIESLGVSALVFEGDTMTAGVSLADGFVFDSSWAGFFLVIAQNPIADHSTFEAAVLAIQSNCIFYYVDDLTDF